MIASRRKFFTGLAALVAAPAIVKVESLMKLAPTEVLKPQWTYFADTMEYGWDLAKEGSDLTTITRLDVLYGKMYIRPEWQFTLDDFSERILAPMMKKLEQQVADAVLYGTGAAKYDLHGRRSIGLADLLREARATPSDG